MTDEMETGPMAQLRGVGVIFLRKLVHFVRFFLRDRDIGDRFFGVFVFKKIGTAETALRSGAGECHKSWPKITNFIDFPSFCI